VKQWTPFAIAGGVFLFEHGKLREGNNWVGSEDGDLERDTIYAEGFEK